MLKNYFLRCFLEKFHLFLQNYMRMNAINTPSLLGGSGYKLLFTVQRCNGERLILRKPLSPRYILRAYCEVRLYIWIEWAADFMDGMRRLTFGRHVCETGEFRGSYGGVCVSSTRSGQLECGRFTYCLQGRIGPNPHWPAIVEWALEETPRHLSTATRWHELRGAVSAPSFEGAILVFKGWSGLPRDARPTWVMRPNRG